MRDVNSVVFGQAGPARQADAGLWGATRIKFDPGPPLTLTRPSGALGQAGDGGDQDRAEHKAHDADRGKDKTLPSGQAFFRTYHDQSIRSVELPGGTGGCQWPDANDSDGFPSARSGRVEVIQLDPVTRTWALMCPLHRGGQGKAVARWAILFDPTGIGP
jgi:hypothetical protein